MNLFRSLVSISAFLFGGYSLYSQQASDYDVIVYGATPGGVIAAVAASRNHARVLLIEQTMHVGGMSTSGLNTAESEHMINNAITGIAREFYIKMGLNYDGAYFRKFGRVMDFKKGDPAFFFESHIAEKEYLKLLADAGVDLGPYDDY